FELTIFRYALAPEPPKSSSPWATNQVYLGHFALTDTKDQRFAAEERLARGAVGLAGAEANPFKVWVEDWSASADGTGFRLLAKGDENSMAIDLALTPVKPAVAQG